MAKRSMLLWPVFCERLLLPLLLAGGSLPLTCRAEDADGEGVCAAGGSCSSAKGAAPGAAAGRGQRYYWPQQKGDVNRTGLSPYKAPFDLSGGPKWAWKDKDHDVTRFTPLIDDERNIYHATLSGRFYKFSPDGVMLWEYSSGYHVPTVPALMDGSIFFSRLDGYVTSLDMKTARLNWQTKISNVTGHDTASIYAIDGLVVSATQIGPKEVRGMGDNNAVVALRASDGSHVWTYRHRWTTFNWQASSPGDGTMVFQDRSGGIYRLSLGDGSVIWESGVLDRSEDDFTTGAAVVGPNGLVYAASNYRGSGIIHAYRLTDGRPVWRRTFDMPVNQAVAVGRLAGSERLSVVSGIGKNPFLAAVLYAALILFAVDAAALCVCGCCCCVRACAGRRFRCCRSLLALLLLVAVQVPCLWAYHQLSLAWEAEPPWLFFGSPKPAAMLALDAETGETRWSYAPPAFHKPACESDESMLMPRLYQAAVLQRPGEPFCLPDNWAQMVIDASGTAYAGHQDGYIYAVRDADGSGGIDPELEVSRYFVGAAFQASQAIAPGILAVVPCGGGLFVWGD